MELPLEYRTRDIQLDLEGLSFQLTLVANTDDLMDRLLAKGEAHEDVRDERIPYWADLWPSAIALSRYLIREQIIRPGITVLEIGCGLGLPGIVAGRLGAEVIFTDYLEEALQMARHNWEQNLDRPARFERMDWRRPLPDFAADMVLASDVAYEARAFAPLPEAFQALCRPGGAVLLSEPNRAIARPFLRSLPQKGFSVTDHCFEGQYEQILYRVNVHHLLREANA